MVAAVTILALVGCRLRAAVAPSNYASGGRWQGVSEPWLTPAPAERKIFLLTDTGGNGHYMSLSSVAIYNARHGGACGGCGVFKTSDGGFTWRRVKPRGAWCQVALTGPHEIWLLENPHPLHKPAILWHSVDNGKIWRQELPGKLYYWFGIGDMYARGPVIWAVNDQPGGVSYYSRDDGKTWRTTNFGRLFGRAWCIAVPGEPTHGGGYVVYVLGLSGNQPQLVKSLDGGKTWKSVPLPPHSSPKVATHSMFFITGRKGWIGCTGGKVLFTRNGGRTWQQRNLPTKETVQALWFDQLGRGFAAVINSDSGAAVYQTFNGGKKWNGVLAGHKQINAFCYISGNLWAVGATGGSGQDIVAILKPGTLDSTPAGVEGNP